MKLTNSIKSIAIGSFDGIHKAHKVLIGQVEAVVIIERNRGSITTGYRRSFYVDKACFFYHFEKIKDLSAKEFVLKLEEDFPQLEKIVVGYDFGFGYKKRGDTHLLKKLFKGEVRVVDEVKIDNLSVHSHLIKNYIKEGNIYWVNRLLEREYLLRGRVIKGQGLGKKELVATVNLRVENYQLPKSGVYVTKTKIGNEWLKSITFLGHRVTTDGNYAIETHILEREIGEVEGNISIKFIDFIRENRKFNGLDALKHQIQEDISVALKIESLPQ